MAPAADENFIARPYQDELIEEALKRNIICVLGTGTGKTYIAVKVIQAMQHDLEKDIEHGGKRTVFLVPTVPLVEQQSGVIFRHTGLKTGKYSSSERIDNLNITEWRQSFRTNKVLVMVPDVLQDLLTKAFLEPEHINLLVLDECHHTAKDHPYREIMRLLFPHKNGPRILGLTASGINISLKKKNVPMDEQLEDEIKELESGLNCTVLTSLDESLAKHGARPSPIVETYQAPPENANDQEVLESIDDMANFLDVAKQRNFFSAFERPNSLSVSLLESDKWIKDSIKDIKNAISQVKNTLTSMGPYCAYMTSRHLLKDWKSMLERNLFRKELCDLVCVCICRLQLIGSWFEVRYNLGNVQPGCSEAVISRLITPKIKKLLTLLEPYLRSTTDTSKELCCIIFVEERYNAWALHQFLQLLRAAPEGTYSKINSGFCVGQLDESGAEENTGDKMGLSLTQLQSTLRKFRSGEVNILVATNVVEEGFDVRECNLIIRLNAPQNYRSYVQSKGRARAKNSKFLMMVAHDEEQNFRNTKLKQFAVLDLILQNHCVGRSSPTEEERITHFADDVRMSCPPFQPPGSKACITLGSALKSLQTYCNSLPNDNMTTCLVWPKIEKRGDNTICTLYLPLNAAIKEPVMGPEMESTVLAKKAAALWCCRMLYEKGELSTEHLLPKDKDLEWTDEIAKFVGYRDKEPVGTGEAQPGTRRRLQLYPVNVPTNFANITPVVGSVYLYRIVWTSTSFSASQAALNEKFPVGFVSGCELMTMPKFPLYHELNAYEVDFQLVKKLSVDAVGLKCLQDFHQCIFENVFLFDRSRLRFAPDGLPHTVLCVPLTNDGQYLIDWQVVAPLIRPGSFQIPLSMEASDRKQMVMDADRYRDAVVVTDYQKGAEPERYFVIDIPDLTPLTYIVKDGKNCHQYMLEKYRIIIMHPHSPLLCVRHCPKSFDFVRPKPRETKKDVNRDILLPMEFCHVLPISVQWYQSFRIMPYVLYRLRTFHNTFDLYRRIRREVWNDGTLPGQWKPLRYEQQQPDVYLPPPPRSTSSSSISSNGSGPSGSAVRENGSPSETSPDEEPGLFSMKYEQKMYYLKRSVKRNQPSSCSPSSSPLFSLQSLSVTDTVTLPILENPPQYFDHEFSSTAVLPCPELTSFVKALTTAFVGDGFNMERLETIGDAFLKMITCVYLFMEYPQHHEGRLTAIKGIQVSNYNLYRLGKLKSLQNYVINVNVFADAKKLYLPPGFIPLERMVELPGDDCYYQLPLRDKSMADVVEALIGMILLEGNARYAQLFMQWMGLKAIHPRGGIGSGSLGNVPRALLRKEGDPLLRDLPRFTAGFSDFERRIGYTFRDKSFLLQAFSHNSYFENRLTDCYQRLEFLGDAILDYLVTRHLYHSNNNLSPGRLTDLRTALVDNKTFAKLAAKYGYHNCIRYSSTKIFGLIAQYVDEVSLNDPDVEPLSAEMFAGFDDDDEEDKNADIYEAAEDPKVLGDVFESVAGAIFLDSGLSLDAVWKVYYNIMQKRLDFCLKHCPKNPKRELLEREPNNVTFLPPTVSENGKVIAEVQVADKGTFHGKGNNLRAARCNAAKVALKALYPGVLCD